MLKATSYLQNLKARKFHKLIIGAALKDYKAIEDFSYYFTHAQADVIDISAFPHSVISAKNGIHKALNEDSNLNEPLIMVSVNIGEDPHFRRIKLDWDNCTECLACIPTCPSNAFSVNDENDRFAYNADLCFGCSNCLPACDFSAMEFEAWSAFKPESLSELQGLGAKAIEIHLNNDLQAFEEFYSRMPEFELESFCIGSEQMTTAELIKATDSIIEQVTKKNNKAFIIQTDGIPLSGARNLGREDKDLVSIENAKLVIEHIKQNYSEIQEKIFVQIAGGITEHSLALANKHGVAISGVAIGSYARKLLQTSHNPIKHAKNLIATSLELSSY
jgi:Fe-S-cluster-containing hydrogenase component 2